MQEQGCSRTLPVNLIILALGPTQQMPRLRHANTMPTHLNPHHKGAAAEGSGPLVVCIFMCWDGVGIPQPGHLLGRPKGKDYSFGRKDY